MTRKLFSLFCISALVCGFASCQWHEAKAVIALADSLDRTEHIIHDDTVALRGVIRILDNPLERWIHKNTLGKAYYYMGRNLSLSNCIAEAAKCYVEADRLQIDDPIIRGRVNSNMGNISDHNNNDSLALIFYERASEDFKESGNMWRYAHSILDICEFNVALGNYNQSDSLLKIAETYLLDSSYQARLNETRGICFYNKLQYDSAMVYFNRALSYWQGEEDKCFSYLKMMQSYYFGKNDINSAIYYAKILISTSNNPNYLSNAYYCLMQDAKTQNNVEQLSQYSHARTDAQKLLRNFMVKDAEALPILMVYDKNNALILSQTGNQRADGTFWTIYKYDEYRRLVYTAEIDARSNDHESLMESHSQWDFAEQFSVSNQTYPMANTGYSRRFYHTAPTKLLSVNYYDNYDFLTFVPDSLRNSMAYSLFDGNNAYSNAQGLLTGSRTYYLDGSNNYSETVYYYDYRGREIQRRTTNHLGGIDVLSTKYDFVNNITDTWSSQSTNNGIITTEHYQYTYDHANRPLTTTYTFNNESPIVLQSYNYDELGRVHSRHIYGGIDSIAFNYNIRNQITQIKSSGYEQRYYYNQPCPIATGYSGGLYNGNISATTWTYGNITNGHVYTYDKMNRLVSNYCILDGSLNVDYLYSESFTYDPHGNITSIERWDDNDAMDVLGFTYVGNQLQSIDDRGAETFHYDAKHYHDNSNSSNDFAYDANGNMIYDQDRGIAAIRYNLLNLPDTIQFTNGNLIIHRYDAAGTRLETKYLTKKIATTVPLEEVVETPVHPQFFYITRDAFHNNIVYTANNTDAYGIEFVHNPEGYIRYYGPEEHYHFYYIKDLLGNIRETYVHPDPEYKECIQRMQYYPSGLPWAEAAGSSEQPWKYNGKEFVEMHGLDEYDSKARWYYPAICRTTTMDPLAETYYPTSPYAWCGNNPIKHVDRNGKWIESAWDVANIGIDIASLQSNIKDRNVGGAIVDGVGLVLDLCAAILPVIPGGAGATIKAIRTADEACDVLKIADRKILPNGGKASPHGGVKHNAAIDTYIENLPAEAINIRKNQTQVDVNGNKVGNNRPDVQYDIDEKHINVEFDTKSNSGTKHKQTILKNDPNATVILNTINQ